MAQVKQKPKKSYLVAVELFPAGMDIDRLLIFVQDHLMDQCGYRKSNVNRMLIYGERNNKLSITSPLPSTHALEKHLAIFRDRLRVRDLLAGLKKLRYEGSAVFSIAVIYSSVACTISIPADLVNYLSSTGLPVEIACYPGSAS